MKSIFLAVTIILFAFTACEKQNATATTPLNEMVDLGTASNTKTGMFINGPFGVVSGTARIYITEGKHRLALENITTSNGPDLHVYLSKEIYPIKFIDLGKLKSTSGNQVYDVSGMPNYADYKYALIHCQQYDHLFGSAELK